MFLRELREAVLEANLAPPRDTHSPDATSFAIREEPILPYLTALAHGFGGPVPCTDEVVGGPELGRAAVDVNPTDGAVLLRRHGVD